MKYILSGLLLLGGLAAVMAIAMAHDNTPISYCKLLGRIKVPDYQLAQQIYECDVNGMACIMVSDRRGLTCDWRKRSR